MKQRLFAIALALGVGLVLIGLVSAEPWQAFRALITGPLPYAERLADGRLEWHRVTRFGLVIEDTISLTLLGLAVLIGFRARQFALGADGQLFLSALAAAAVSVALADRPWLALPAATLAALATGFAWGGVPGLLKARFGANEIVTTLMLNVIAVQFYRLCITRWFNDPGAGFLASPLIGSAAAFRPLLPDTHVTAFVLVAALAVGAAWYLVERTTLGFEIRAVGDSTGFARAVGIPVRRTIVLAMGAGGAFAGLAGLHLSNALLRRLPVELTPGLGFEGLVVVALLARNRPLAVPVAALLYAWLKGGAVAMERASDVSREMVLVVQACIVLFVVSERLWPARLVERLREAWGRREALRRGQVP